MISQHSGHLFYGGFEVDDLLGERPLAITFELEHGSEAAHVLMQTSELLGEGDLQQLHLLQLLHLLRSHLLQVCLQLLDLISLGVHVASVITVAVLQLP